MEIQTQLLRQTSVVMPGIHVTSIVLQGLGSVWRWGLSMILNRGHHVLVRSVIMLETFADYDWWVYVRTAGSVERRKSFCQMASS